MLDNWEADKGLEDMAACMVGRAEHEADMHKEEVLEDEEEDIVESTFGMILDFEVDRAAGVDTDQGDLARVVDEYETVDEYSGCIGNRWFL